MDIPLEKVQKTMDEQLLKLEKECHELRMRRNTYTHFSKLSNELLLKIFMIIKAQSSSFRDWHQKLNLVCRHWRAVVIGAPTLWRQPHTRQHDLTLLMLERSKPVDLTVYIEAETAPHTTAAILENMKRIKLLSVRQNLYGLNETQDAWLKVAQEASPLRFLIVSDTSCDQHPKFQLSPNVLLGLNKLQYLRLSDIGIDWNSLPLHANLGHLHLENTTLVNLIVYQQLLDALRQMPQLKVLFLTLPTTLPPQESSISVNQRAHLPLLYHLTLFYALPDHLHSFLTHMEMPCLRYAYIRCDDASTYAAGDYLMTTQALSELLRNGDFGRGFRSMAIQDASLRVSIVEPAPGSKYSDYPPSLDIHLTNFWGSNEDEDFDGDQNIPRSSRLFTTRIFLGILDMAHNSGLLRNLTDVEISRVLDSHRVLRLLSKLPEIKNLTVTHRLVAPLTDALTIPGPGILPVDQPLLFPSLNSITWRNVDCRKTTILPHLEQFRDCLMLRHEYGLSVHEMRLFHCSWTQVEVNLLSEIVPEVNVEDLSVFLVLD